jgi:hypothetical protein
MLPTSFKRLLAGHGDRADKRLIDKGVVTNLRVDAGRIGSRRPGGSDGRVSREGLPGSRRHLGAVVPRIADGAVDEMRNESVDTVAAFVAVQRRADRLGREHWQQ